MFSSPFPNFISFICKDLSFTKNYNLLPEEEKIVASFDSPKRKAEFIMGRAVSHLALKKFKLESIPILRNINTREPCWPKSVFGSITHSGNLAAAAVGLNSKIAGIGIDLEKLSRKINFEISRHICVDNELKWLKTLDPEQAKLNLRIIFSAKESIFKCFFPISRKHLNFKDAYININEKKSEFTYILSTACSNITDVGFSHKGHFSVKDDFLLTSTYIKKYPFTE